MGGFILLFLVGREVFGSLGLGFFWAEGEAGVVVVHLGLFAESFFLDIRTTFYIIHLAAEF